jgi:sec-independent protein translocase protein TatA
MIGLSKLLLILLIATLVFGVRRLPEIGAGLGKAIKNFKAGLSGQDEIDVTPKKDEIADGRGGKS